MFSIKRVFRVEPSRTMAIIAVVATVLWIVLSWLWWPRMPVTVPAQPLAFPEGPSLQGDYFDEVKYTTFLGRAASGEYAENPRTIGIAKFNYGYYVVVQAGKQDGKKKVVVQADNVVDPGLAYFFYTVAEPKISDGNLLIQVEAPNALIVAGIEVVIAVVWLICFYCCFGEWKKAATGKTS